MNLRYAPLAVAALASLVGCAASADDTSTASANLDQATTIAACEYHKPCVDAVVLRAVFNSSAMVASEGDRGETPLPQYVASWLGVSPDRGTVEITTEPSRDGVSTAVRLLVSMSSPNGEMATGCWLDFTIEGASIRETRLTPSCAG